ncbi:hypothetical protein [Amycolatopsis alkalitolerans]|uniref:Esterase-like activity of phytase family protein n=1 Tax=Amycolatopsis alkalitolerans TaxID=2547244 RepID=A0A5C4M789_9PSEU|nr:hypothetical protein [Amycolatopsis alkalitolerans]TNC29237.1 hypothetical protein FG385_02100 [Amycolatopsis alkalitolerans]
MRWGALLATFSFVLALSVAPAAAADAPATVCTVSDQRLTEMSGLVSDGQWWYAINDGGSKVQVFVLGHDCAVQRVITNSLDPYDPEDLARTPDGTLWLSDTGDNDKKRATVALVALPPQGKATLYRLTYPDGQHDVEALLLDRQGTPYLVTKTPFGDSGVYRPVSALTSPGPTPLEKVGTVEFKTTGTPGGPVAGFGSVLVTGAASSADGTVVALRTYTDAYLYLAPDGDVAAALKRAPVRIPLPDEQQGEALAFEPDGTLLSGGEGAGQPIRAVKNAASLVAPPTQDARDGAPAAAGHESSSGAGGSPGISPVSALILAVVLAGGGLFAVARLRRRSARK